ncbi:MAG TPA: HEAT repeat domain-containing protein [Gemmataceae bacterium]|nr:HEAT repeat domain-containing protein [Gemmataceae bacterium]
MKPFLSVTPCLVLLTALPAASGAETHYQGKPVRHWVQMLQNKDLLRRQRAVVALGQIGRSDKTALPALRDSLKDDDTSVRIAAAGALNALGADPELTARHCPRWRPP